MVVFALKAAAKRARKAIVKSKGKNRGGLKRLAKPKKTTSHITSDVIEQTKAIDAAKRELSERTKSVPKRTWGQFAKDFARDSAIDALVHGSLVRGVNRATYGPPPPTPTAYSTPQQIQAYENYYSQSPWTSAGAIASYTLGGLQLGADVVNITRHLKQNSVNKARIQELQRVLESSV